MKSGKVRFCINHRPLNESLRREHYKLLVFEDVLTELSKATKFSIFDFKSDYHQCIHLLTMFVMHFCMAMTTIFHIWVKSEQ